MRLSFVSMIWRSASVILVVDTPKISRHEIRERTVDCSDKILPLSAKL